MVQHNAYLNHPHFSEPDQLYDLKNDPWEEHNLANDPKYIYKLQELRGKNEAYIRNNKDLGFLSWEERTALTKQGKDFYSWVRETNYPLDSLITLAEKASEGNIEYLDVFIEHLNQ